MNRYFKISQDDGKTNYIVAAQNLTYACYQYDTEVMMPDGRIKPQKGMITVTEIPYDVVRMDIRRRGSTVLFTRDALTDHQVGILNEYGYSCKNNTWARRGVELFGVWDHSFVHIGKNTTFFPSSTMISEALNSLRFSES